MQTILAHFDGKNIVPDQPLSLPTGQALRIAIESMAAPLPALPPELEEQDRGMIVVRGSRIPLYLILESLGQGKSWEEILAEFPTIPATSVQPIDQYIAQNEVATRKYFEAEKAELDKQYASGKKASSLESLRGKISSSRLTSG